MDLIMVGIVWDEQQKSHEWSIAKKELSDSNGRLLPNGTKLTRKKSGLHHSFIVIDNKIVALNATEAYLGKGIDAKVKLAEDEKGRLIALKIAIKTKDSFFLNANEESIANDLGIAGKKTTRVNRKEEKKEYLAYKYLGTPLNNYINNYIGKNCYKLSLDERYAICIKVALILHDLHSGAKSKTNSAYLHGDFHCANIVIDDAGNPHIIDFGRSHASKYNGRSVVMNESNKLANDDTVQLLQHFYKPPNRRNFNEGEFFGILGDAMPEYKLTIDDLSKGSKNQIQLSLIKNDTDLMYENLSYNFKDVNGNRIEGVIPLNQLGIEPVACGFARSIETPEEKEIKNRVFLEKDKILEIIAATGVAIDKTKLNHNKTLLRMLNNYESTALDMAETLTLCRFNLEFLQDVLTQCSADERVLTTCVLNSQSSGIFELYNQIGSLASEGTQTNAFENEVKSFLLKHASSKETDIKALNALLHQCPSSTIKQSMNELVNNIVQEKELVAQAKSFNSLINEILLLKKHRGADVVDELESIHSDLREAGNAFFDKRYATQTERDSAFKNLEDVCEKRAAKAETYFQDKPGVWPCHGPRLLLH